MCVSSHRDRGGIKTSPILFIMKTLNETLDFAREVHKNDKRADGRPYFEHIDLVVRILKYWKTINDIQVIGALHDVIEMHPEYTDQIKITYTDDIFAALLTLNNSEFPNYTNYLLDIKERYLHHVNTRDDEWTEYALTVKGADIIANYYDTLYFPSKNEHQMKHLKNKSEMAFYILFSDKLWERKELDLIKKGLI